MGEVDGDVPGLVGPKEMSRWHLAMEWDQEKGDSVTIMDHDGLHRGPVIWGPKRHPVVDLMDYEGECVQVFTGHPCPQDDDDEDEDDDDYDDGDDDDDDDDEDCW